MISDFAKEKVFWTRKMNIKLVKFMENRPNIWNPKHPKYTSVQYRDKTYAEFASKYGDEFTGETVKHRWTNIRSTFANYLRKLNASRAKGDVEEYKINWHLWQPCQFLLKVNKNGQYHSTKGEKVVKQEINDSKNWDSETDITTETNSDDMCRQIAENLVLIFRGVQNDSFGLENTKNRRIGQAVSEKLAQCSSYDATIASKNIIDILLLYDKNNPNNPNRLMRINSLETEY